MTTGGWGIRAGRGTGLVEFAVVRRVLSHRGALAGVAVLALFLLCAVAPGALSLHAPEAQFRDALLVPPVFEHGGTWRFPLGTDDLGRDIASRLVHGARLSMLVGIVAVAAAAVPGILLGLASAALPPAVAAVLARAIDVLMAMPGLLLAIVVVALLGPGLDHAIVAISLVAIPSYFRLTRAGALAEAGRDYVTATRAVGASPVRILFATILPNIAAPLIVQSALGFSGAILDAAALGFLGLGAQPPQPEWGAMLADARDYIERAWWVVTFPGLAILSVVYAANLFADGLRDALDPRLRGR
jgi:dipeptide transport system permease protein